MTAAETPARKDKFGAASTGMFKEELDKRHQTAPKTLIDEPETSPSTPAQDAPRSIPTQKKTSDASETDSATQESAAIWTATDAPPAALAQTDLNLSTAQNPHAVTANSGIEQDAVLNTTAATAASTTRPSHASKNVIQAQESGRHLGQIGVAPGPLKSEQPKKDLAQTGAQASNMTPHDGKPHVASTLSEAASADSAKAMSHQPAFAQNVVSEHVTVQGAAAHAGEEVITRAITAPSASTASPEAQALTGTAQTAAAATDGQVKPAPQTVMDNGALSVVPPQSQKHAPATQPQTPASPQASLPATEHLLAEPVKAPHDQAMMTQAQPRPSEETPALFGQPAKADSTQGQTKRQATSASATGMTQPDSLKQTATNTPAAHVHTVQTPEQIRTPELPFEALAQNDVDSNPDLLPQLSHNERPLQSIPTSTLSLRMSTGQAVVPPTDLAMHIAKHVQNGDSHFEIRIDPPELGRIEVKMTVNHEGRIQAVLMAERPETLDMMQRDQRQLEQALRDMGVDVDSGSLDFSLRDGNGQEDKESDWQANARLDHEDMGYEEDLVTLAEMQLPKDTYGFQTVTPLRVNIRA